MPALLILGPLFGLAAWLMVAHSQKAPALLASTGAGLAPATRQIELDHGMPEGLVHEVLSALVHDQDAAKLEGLANHLGTRYPLASGELRAKAATLADTSKGVEGRPGPDTSDAAVILQAAMRALTEETDPVSLEGFAESIRTKYPTATILLLGRARDLRASGSPPAVMAPAGLPPASPGASTAPPLPAPVSPPPAHAAAIPAAATAPTYHVQTGDTPSRIAEKLGHASAWRDLIVANPGKATTADGNFASLRAGEILTLPTSWGPAAAASAPTHAAEVRS